MVDPSEPSAWAWSTVTHAWLDHGDEAVRRAPRAIELSPFAPNMYSFTAMSGTAHAVAGLYDEAIRVLQQSLRQNRMVASSHRVLVIALALSGRADEARQATAGLLALEPALTVGGFVARYPGRNSSHVERFAQALASAGIPP